MDQLKGKVAVVTGASITERRVLEQLDTGSVVTPYLHYGDKVRLEILDDRGQSIFGAIEQTVARPAG